MSDQISKLFEVAVGEVSSETRDLMASWAFARSDVGLLAQLAACGEVSPALDERLGEVSAPAVRSAWLTSPRRSVEQVRRGVATESRPTVLRAVACRDDLPRDVVEVLIASRSKAVLKAVMANVSVDIPLRVDAAVGWLSMAGANWKSYELTLRKLVAAASPEDVARMLAVATTPELMVYLARGALTPEERERVVRHAIVPRLQKQRGNPWWLPAVDLRRLLRPGDAQLADLVLEALNDQGRVASGGEYLEWLRAVPTTSDDGFDELRRLVTSAPTYTSGSADLTVELLVSFGDRLSPAEVRERVERTSLRAEQMREVTDALRDDQERLAAVALGSARYVECLLIVLRRADDPHVLLNAVLGSYDLGATSMGWWAALAGDPLFGTELVRAMPVSVIRAELGRQRKKRSVRACGVVASWVLAKLDNPVEGLPALEALLPEFDGSLDELVEVVNCL